MEWQLKLMKLKDLHAWPPQPGGAQNPGTVFPTAGQAVVDEVFPLREKSVTFRAIFDGQSHSYHYKAENERIAERIHAVVTANIGRTVAELGDLGIEN